MCAYTGDGAFSFQEFVEIVYNMGGTAEKTADQEEKELRDAFRVRSFLASKYKYKIFSLRKYDDLGLHSFGGLHLKIALYNYSSRVSRESRRFLHTNINKLTIRFFCISISSG